MSNTILLGKTLKGADVYLNLQQLATGRTFICCISGGGKTHFATRVTEQSFGQVGIIIIDVEGEYSRLRENYPFLIIGKDVPLTPEAAGFLAEQVLENELSVIIDGSDPNLDEATFQEFVRDFLNRFLAIETAKRKPYLVIAEEVDELAPEHNFATSLCGPAVLKVAKKGRKRGLGIMTLTQRPALEAKGVISQSRNKGIGQLDWDPDKQVVQKFARIPQDITDRLDQFKRGDFYISGDWVDKPGLVHVGPVKTKHVGETPEIVPPAPRELAGIVASLTKKLPDIIQEKLIPAVPKVAEIEERVKKKLEGEYQARLLRKDKELATIKNKTEAKDAVEIADLKRKLEEVARSAALKGGAVSDLLQHPLVVAAFKKAELDERQQSLVELLEKGSRTNEQLRLFLQTGSDGVDHVRRAINKKIPGLIDLEKGQYVSRLAKLFPVTEELKAEAKESEALRVKLEERGRQLSHVQDQYTHMEMVAADLRGQVTELEKKVKILEITNQRLVEISQGKTIPAERATVPVTPHAPGTPDAPNVHPTPATLEEIPGPATKSGTTELVVTRTLTGVKVRDEHKVLEVDKSTWPGKVCLLALEDPSFLADEKSALKATEIGKQLERRFNITAPTSGNSLTALANGLAGLVDDGILARKSVDKSWNYWRRPEFNERVRPFQEAAAQ